MKGLGYKEILDYLDGNHYIAGSSRDPEERYQTFCKAPDHLV